MKGNGVDLLTAPEHEALQSRLWIGHAATEAALVEARRWARRWARLDEARGR